MLIETLGEELLGGGFRGGVGGPPNLVATPHPVDRSQKPYFPHITIQKSCDEIGNVFKRNYFGIEFLMPRRVTLPSSNFIARGTAMLVALAGVAMFLMRAYQGIWSRGFVDETTHLLGSKVVNSGGILYRDFVDNHGPVIYMFVSTYGKFAGWTAPNYARLIPLLLVACAGGAVAASPSLITKSARLCAIGLFFGLAASVWIAQGLYQVSFYPVAGALAAIIISSFVAPAWFGRPIPPACATVAGFAAGLLVFTGYQYSPAVLLFAMVGLCCVPRDRNRTFVMFIAGGLVASALVLIWLARYGDFLGYLAFHIAFGQTAFRPFLDMGLHHFLGSLNPNFSPAYLVQALAVIGFVGSALLLLVPIIFVLRTRRLLRLCACILGLIGIIMLNARGEPTFKDGSFLIGVIAMVAIALPAVANEVARLRPGIGISLPFIAVILLAAIEAAAGFADTTPLSKRSAPVPIPLIGQPSNDPIANRIRSILGPDDRFLALVYQPDLYFAADRLPISGYFAYFPWDAAYARNPWFNRPHDLCITLANHPPKLIVFDNWTVWDRYMPRDYMPCLLNILYERYKRDQDFPTLYVYDDPRPANQE